MAVSFIGGGNQNSRRKPHDLHSLVSRNICCLKVKLALISNLAWFWNDSNMHTPIIRRRGIGIPLTDLTLPHFCLFLTNAFSLRATPASCRFLYDVWNSPYTRASFTLPPKVYLNNDSSLLEGLWHWNGKNNKVGLIFNTHGSRGSCK